MGTSAAAREAALADRLQRLLVQVVDRSRVVRHGLLAVAAVDGSFSWEGGHGVLDEDGTLATSTARYPIASVTKLATAAVVMRAVERGAVELSCPLVELLPAEQIRGLHVIDGVDRTAQITLEHLLGHTSGLPDYYEQAPKGGPSPQARLLAGEDVPFPYEEVLRTVREELTPHFPPQDLQAPKVKARYADTNFQLLGAVVEAIEARPLRVVFAEDLLAAHGLDDTSCYPDRPRSGRSAEPDARVWSKQVVLQPAGMLTTQVADGGMISTVADQVAFMRALVTGAVFDDPGTWERMRSGWHRVMFPIEYGLGVMRYAPSRWMSLGASVPEMIGHTGSTATWLFHVPSLDVIVAGALDVAQPSLPFRFVPRVLQAVSRSRS